MRADIHDGQEPIELQSKAGYIDARPLTANSMKPSCNARPDHTLGQTATTGHVSVRSAHQWTPVVKWTALLPAIEAFIWRRSSTSGGTISTPWARRTFIHSPEVRWHART